jgi:hypothetical protein
MRRAELGPRPAPKEDTGLKVHAKAALSLKRRRELCWRVVEGERSLSETAPEVTVRCELCGEEGLK